MNETIFRTEIYLLKDISQLCDSLLQPITDGAKEEIESKIKECRKAEVSEIAEEVFSKIKEWSSEQNGKTFSVIVPFRGIFAPEVELFKNLFEEDSDFSKSFKFSYSWVEWTPPKEKVSGTVTFTIQVDSLKKEKV